MGLFGKKVDYDEFYRKLSTEKMTGRELKKAEKLLDKLEDSGDRRGILWKPLISIQCKLLFFESGIPIGAVRRVYTYSQPADCSKSFY